jgi:small subunit ribosomal protein S1
MSQIDTERGAEPEEHVGRTYTFRIIEFKEGGKDLVLSRRAILEEEAREKAREVMSKVIPDAVLPGRVASVTDYGAFVDLGGGVQGLLHVSEMGWTRVSSPSEVVQPGQDLAVQVLRVDDEGRKISLSLKHLQADPWLMVGGAYRAGQKLQGRVTRLAEFGAFVELEPGIEALAHVSTFPLEGLGPARNHGPLQNREHRPGEAEDRRRPERSPDRGRGRSSLTRRAGA